MDVDKSALFIPDEGLGGSPVVLARNISAIQLVKKEDGGAKLGFLVQLAAGTKVLLCGDGFNERTVKIRAEGNCYFVFRQDVSLDGSCSSSN